MYPIIKQILAGNRANFSPKGFTLVELLVVVLIIGILAAVAIPQYQVAVAKARINRLLALVKNIETAQEVYKMENGTYANDFSLLDIELPAGEKGHDAQSVWYDDFSLTIGVNSGQYNSLYYRDTKYQFKLERYYSAYTICWAENDALAKKMCKYLCGVNYLIEDKKCYF